MQKLLADWQNVLSSRVRMSSRRRTRCVAVEGCCHGELDSIYRSVERTEKEAGVKVDLLIICGDFQAVRNVQDLGCMAVPPKYRKLGDFARYYSGSKKAPILTIFVGGNHEASNHLHELYFGGWVCPNIYYLGQSGVINAGGIRIAGLSGIYKQEDYTKPLFEQLPYNDSTLRSIYHVRQFEELKLLEVKDQMDVCLSHDWPMGIERHGNLRQLLERKKHFREDVDTGRLGSAPARRILEAMKPAYWFSAHLHTKYAALYDHASKNKQNEDEIELDLDDGGPELSKVTPKTTKFLALDKCLPRRDFLQILNIPIWTDEPMVLSYDKEWLSILRLYHEKNQPLGDVGSSVWEEARRWVLLNILDLTVPLNFQITAPIQADGMSSKEAPKQYNNPQTSDFCRLLDIPNPLQGTSPIGGGKLK